MMGTERPTLIESPHPEERIISAFTHVHSPSKTGLNALETRPLSAFTRVCDALWAAPQDEVG